MLSQKKTLLFTNNTKTTMRKQILATILFAATGCLLSAYGAGSTLTNPATASVAQSTTKLYVGGSQKGEIRPNGAVYIGGSQKGEFRSNGAIYVGGSQKGEIRSNGAIYKNGSQVGEVRSNGAVYKGGSQVGEVRSNGAVYKGGSQYGEARNMENIRWVAAAYFFDFFGL
jgi:hypothetical protein